MNKHLVKALADLVASVELSSDEVIDPDFAIRLLEQTSAELNRLDEEGKVRLDKAFRELAGSGSDERSDFIRNLGDHLGIAEKSEES